MPFWASTGSTLTTADVGTYDEWLFYPNNSTVTSTTTSSSATHYIHLNSTGQTLSYRDYVNRLYMQWNETIDWDERDQIYREARAVQRAVHESQLARRMQADDVQAQQARAYAGLQRQWDQERAHIMSRQHALEESRALEQRRSNDNKARRRARLLLISQLTPNQKKDYLKSKSFIVVGGQTKTRYRIREEEHLVGNVDVLDGRGRVTHRLCAHAPLGSVPLGDQLLTQKVYLEYYEEHFLRTANRHAA